MILFAQPELLWLLALVPMVMLLRGRRGPVAAIEFSDVGLAREVARTNRTRAGRWMWLFPLLAAALMIVGLARPQRAHSRTEITANGIDIVLGLDVSGSMQALDFQIDNQRVNRIEIVKSVVSKFIEERPNDRIGLIAFAAAPYLVSPLTLDHDWLQQNLERVSTALTQDDGTAIGSAIAAAVNRLRTTSAKSKVVILLTDGMNNTGKISPLAAAEAAKAMGVKIYTIGVGVRGMAPIVVKDEQGRPHLVMDKVDVDEKTLQAVAGITGGTFYRATDTDSLKKIYEQINRLETTAQVVKKFEHREELYSWTLLPAVVILCFGLLLQHTRFRRLP
jgi:Ca-activated chloride channel homolog